MKFNNLISIALALATVASANAFAAPVIDQELLPLMTDQYNGSNPNRMVRTIIFFHDMSSALDEVKAYPHSRTYHQQVELAMRANAEKSQERVLQQLRGFAESGTPIRAHSLWLFNAMVVDLPATHVQKLAQFEEIKFISANHPMKLVHPTRIENPMNEGQGPYTYGLQKLGIPDLMAKRNDITGKGVLVGILDTGIDAAHPDLGRVANWKDFTGENSAQPIDSLGHGSHVAGTITGGNASGTRIGIAPDAKIVYGRIFGSQGSTTQDIIMNGMQWIADPDGNPATNDFPVAVNNSWGAATPPNSQTDPAQTWECQGVAAWTKLGILGVFAAGNEGSNPESMDLPGACPGVMAVGATDSDDNIADFSSRGPATWSTGQFIDPIISAPGVHVYSSWNDGSYKYLDGTSMATPHATGTAVLVSQLAPKATVEQIQEIMSKSADHLGSAGQNNDFGWGRINALKAISSMMNDE